MQPHEEHHRLGPQPVHITHDRAKGHVALDLQDRFIGFDRRRRIKHHQDQTGDRLDEKEKGSEITETKRVCEPGAAFLVKLWSNVGDEAYHMHAIARIGPFGRGLAAQDSPQFIQTDTGGDDPDSSVKQLPPVLSCHASELICKRAKGL